MKHNSKLKRKNYICKKTIIFLVILAGIVGGLYYLRKENTTWTVSSNNTVSGSFLSSNKNDNEKKQHEYKFNNNGTLTVSNINGTVTVKTHDKDMLILDETKKGDKNDFDKIETTSIIGESASGTLGRGGPKIKLSTVNGSISID